MVTCAGPPLLLLLVDRLFALSLTAHPHRHLLPPGTARDPKSPTTVRRWREPPSSDASAVEDSEPRWQTG
jgi:hypothetical protein